MSDIAVVIALKMHVKHNILHQTTKHIKDHVKTIPSGIALHIPTLQNVMCN